MSSHLLVQSLLLFLAVCTDFTYSKVHYITSSLDNPCPQNASSCLTLSQFAANSSYDETDISLYFLKGDHSLDRQLFLVHGHNFSMSKYELDEKETGSIKCTSQLGRFNISEVTYVSIKGLHFIGCSSNRVSQVKQLTIADSIFKDVEDNSTVMELNEVDIAIIERTQFLHNTLDYHKINVIYYLYFEKVRKYIYRHRNRPSGVLHTAFSNVSIINSRFMYNRADIGGALVAHNSSVHIDRGTHSYNKANFGGVMITFGSTIVIDSCIFTFNSAQESGGVMVTYDDRFRIWNSTFTRNNAHRNAGVMITFGNSSLAINSSDFTFNHVAYYIGVIQARDKSSFAIVNSNFKSNFAHSGGVLSSENSLFIINNSKFMDNVAGDCCSVMRTYYNSSFTISNCTFYNNSNINGTGTKMILYRGILLNIYNSNFAFNAVVQSDLKSLGPMIYLFQCSTHIANSIFDHNFGSSSSIYAFNSNLTISGISKFENSKQQFISDNSIKGFSREGGVITSYQSTVIFARDGKICFTSNQARHGGAILAIKSTIVMYGETTIANNSLTAFANNSGGGISLKQSHLEIKGKCTIFNNSAMRGGGIHATSSTISIYQPAILQIINNNANLGGGMYLEVNSNLYVLIKDAYIADKIYLKVTGNHAKYGGAVYVADDTNSGTCSPDNECFIQRLALYNDYDNKVDLRVGNIYFSCNTATAQGSTLFGGLLDRCIPSYFAEVYNKQRIHYSGVHYLQSISNNIALDSISSQPVRVCFCNSEHEPDCSYRLPTITVKKGEAFNVSLVAVDQVNNTVNATISSSISSSDGGFGEGQQTQTVERYCTDLTYNVFSRHKLETINLFAYGPCGSAALSTSYVTIQFTDCTCPVGFQPRSKGNESTKCECICDSKLSPFITKCDYATSSVFRFGTNSWITYINDTDFAGFVKYRYCPFDYCKLLTDNVSINFNLPNGADSQCAYHRIGILCGSCSGKSSLSLASSRCLPCHSYWPAVCVIILLSGIMAGILLVTALLALNMTVSVGLINGFIFYANIVSASSAVFFPVSEPSFPSVFVAWLNLEIGIDVCFIDGLDAYIKTWLQLAFPVYIISLVVVVIIVSDYSPTFARLIGKNDPISTLATLILLSYAKLLSVTITALSFATLDYPNGEQTVWLPDGNVKYFQGKHILLVLVALLIILIGLPYTILLFLWQWIVRAPRWKMFKWTRNTKLIAFISTYHIPHNSKYRYWTGLLLLARVVYYVTASVTESSDPEVLPLISALLIGGLLLLSRVSGQRLYNNSFVNVVDTVLSFNLVALALTTLYNFKHNSTKQTAVVYASTIITFVLFVASICYHVKLLITKKKPPESVNEPLLSPAEAPIAKVTYSVIELPKPDQDPPPDMQRHR